MTGNREDKASIKPLIVAACIAFALEFAGCKGGTDSAGSSEPTGAAGAATNSAVTNSAATNASTTVDTNTTAASTNQ